MGAPKLIAELDLSGLRFVRVVGCDTKEEEIKFLAAMENLISKHLEIGIQEDA